MACAHARSVSGAGIRGGRKVSAAAVVAIASSTASGIASRVRSMGDSLIARRVKRMRWSAVTLESTARIHSAGSSKSNIAPAMRHRSRSGRSIIPTVQSTPIDSARAFV